jgi:hypothetical protein
MALASLLIVKNFCLGKLEEQYPELHAWMLSKMDRFRSVFGPRVKALSLSPGPATDEDDGDEADD